MQKHIKNVHKRDAIGQELSRTQNMTENIQNSPDVLHSTLRNIPVLPENIQVSPHIHNTNLVCEKCTKEYKTVVGLKRHIPKCRGVSNILECHLCHKVLATYQSKSRHIKQCKIRKAKEQAKVALESLSQTDQHNAMNIAATELELSRIQNESRNIQNESNNIQNGSNNIQNRSKNIQNMSKNIQISPNFQKKNLVCEKCSKEYMTFFGLKRHIPKCKGVSNILECHFCHKVLANYNSKSKHIKTCKIRKAQEQAKTALESLSKQTEHHSITNNNTNNNTNNTNNNQQNIYNINNYRISRDDFFRRYNTDNEDIEHINDFGKEDLSYITPEKMHEIALNCDFKTLINEKHFNSDHPENHNIRNNCNKSYKVLKNRKWQVEPKQSVCSEIYSNTHTQIFNYAHVNLLDNELDENESEQYLIRLEQYDKVCKKNIHDYIDVKIKDILRHKQIFPMLTHNANQCLIANE